MKNRGMILVTGLVLLTAVSLLAVTAARGTGLAYRQASNLEDEFRALASARRAEADARAWLVSRLDIERETDCIQNCLLPPAVHSAGILPDNPAYESAAWWDLHGHRAGTNPLSGVMVEQESADNNASLWVMEEIHFETMEAGASETAVGAVAYYRVISRGTGKRSRSVVLTETLLARPWQGDYTAGSFPETAGTADFCAQFSLETPCGTVAWRRLR